MWIFTNKGFISAVQNKFDEGSLVVRARDKKHLTSLFPDKQVILTRVADYRYRIVLTKQEFTDFMVQQIASLDYNNFKDSIKDRDYHSACIDVWVIMERYQYRNQPFSRRGGLFIPESYHDRPGLDGTNRITAKKKRGKIESDHYRKNSKQGKRGLCYLF